MTLNQDTFIPGMLQQAETPNFHSLFGPNPPVPGTHRTTGRRRTGASVCVSERGSHMVEPCGGYEDPVVNLNGQKVSLPKVDTLVPGAAERPERSASKEARTGSKEAPGHVRSNGRKRTGPSAGVFLSAGQLGVGTAGPQDEPMTMQLAVLAKVETELLDIREAQLAHERLLEGIRGQLQEMPEKLGQLIREETIEERHSHSQRLRTIGRNHSLGTMASCFRPMVGQDRTARGSVCFQQAMPGKKVLHSAPRLSKHSAESHESHESQSLEEYDSDTESVREVRQTRPSTPQVAPVIAAQFRTQRTTDSLSTAMAGHPSSKGGGSNGRRDSSASQGSGESQSQRPSWISAGPILKVLGARRAAIADRVDAEAVRLQLTGDATWPVETEHDSFTSGRVSALRSSGTLQRVPTIKPELEPPLRRQFSVIMKPNTHMRLAFDALVILAIILNGLWAPIVLAYLDRSVLLNGSIVGWAMHLSDLVWTLNIYMNFTTGYYDEGRLVMDAASIAKRYSRRWLFIDLLSIYPFILASESMTILTTLTLFKLTRQMRLLQLFSRLQREYQSSKLLPVKVFVQGSLFLHVLACFWRIVQGPMPQGELYGKGDIYVRDLYWVLMTMTTIGYGDIVPQTTHARIYAMFTMVMSPLFFGTIVSGLTHVSEELFKDPLENKVSEATRFMTRRGVSQGLQRRVEHNLRQHIQQEKISSLDPEIFGQLSPSIQRELSLELLSSTVLQFPLFATAPYSFVAELATRFSWLLCMSGDIVVEEGQLVQEAYFVMRGRLYIESSLPHGLRRHRARPSDSEDGPLEFGVGAWFGEVCFFRTAATATHIFTATALVDTEMATLGASDYHKIAQQYPRVEEQQKGLERALEDKRANLNQLAYKCATGHSNETTARDFGMRLFRKASKVMPGLS